SVADGRILRYQALVPGQAGSACAVFKNKTCRFSPHQYRVAIPQKGQQSIANIVVTGDEKPFLGVRDTEDPRKRGRIESNRILSELSRDELLKCHLFPLVLLRAKSSSALRQ